MKLTDAQKLAVLYNNAQQFGRGVLWERGREPMTVEQAQEVLDKNTSGYFDYLYGRAIKCFVSGVRAEVEDGRLYDREYGEGAYNYVLMMAASTETYGVFLRKGEHE